MTDAEKKILRAEQAKRLVEVRSKHFDTATAAAKSLNIPIATYTQYENGKRSLRPKAPILAKAFGVSPYWLLTGARNATVDELVDRLMGIPEDHQREVATAAALGAVETVIKRVG